MTTTALQGWHDYLHTGDDASLRGILDPEVVFESPALHTPQRGQDLTLKYLASARQVLAGPTFRYVGEWRGEQGVVLEFETELEGIRINGVDIIGLTPDGARIRTFKVMIRPLKAINLVVRLMGEQLAKP